MPALPYLQNDNTAASDKQITYTVDVMTRGGTTVIAVLIDEFAIGCISLPKSDKDTPLWVKGLTKLAAEISSREAKI